MATASPIKILFFAANPVDGQPLEIGTEFQGLKDRLCSTRFMVESVFAVKVEDILQRLLEHTPDIVHFSVHGGGGDLYLSADRGRESQPLSAEDLAEKMRIYQAEAERPIRLLVLAGCYTADTARLLSKHVDCTIGATYDIGDDAVAWAFTPEFYGTLAAGRHIQNAFFAAKSRMRSDPEYEYAADMMQLFSRDGVDPAKVILTEIASTQQKSAQRHLAYLRSLFGEDCDWARVSMSLFDPQEIRLARKVSLLDIFTPLPVDFTIAMEMAGDGQDRKWWCGAAHSDSPSQIEREWFDIAWSEQTTRAMPGEKPEDHRVRPRSWTDLDVTEEGLTPLVDMAYQWAAGRRRDSSRNKQTLIWQADASHAALVQPRLVLIGDPGSGKSTFLRHLALCWAGHRLRAAGHGDVPAAATLDALPGWTHAYTPIYIEMRALVGSFAPLAGSAGKEPGLKELRAHLRSHLPVKQDDDLINDLFSLLKQGKAALLLDGLDEISEASVPERQAQIHGFISTLVDEFPHAPILVTARPYAYEQQEWRVHGFGHTRLAPLGGDRQEAFAQRLIGRLLQQDRTRDAGREGRAFIAALHTIRNDLRSNPLLLTLLVALWIRKEPGERDLPSTRGELYRRAVTLLVKDWVATKYRDEKHPEREYELPVGEEDWRIVLEQVAFDAQERRKSRDDAAMVLVTDILRALHRLGKGRVANDLLDHLSYQANILERVPVLEETYEGQYKFLHGTFQEYLAACELLYRSEDQRPPGLPLLSNRRFPGGLAQRMIDAPVLWANVLRFAVDELLTRPRIADACTLLNHCCEPYRNGKEGKQTALLALQVALDAKLLDKAKQVAATGYDILREDARRILLDYKEFTPEQRDIAGRLLGSGPFPGHDTRKGVGVKDGLPDIDWVPISKIDPQTGRAEWTYQDRTPKPLDTYWIARYPITYAQFEVFLRAEDGYQEDRWWRGLAASREHRLSADNQNFEHWNHPRERVSWYDAMAFCRWLTAKAHGHPGLLPKDARCTGNWQITLPTEQQWEKAARGHDGRRYPWGGDEYKSGYANIDETGAKVGPHNLQKTTAVGMYPQGVSPYGVADLSGNVWEWCLNEYRSGKIDPRGDATRVLRGGSWTFGFPVIAAAPFRNLYLPPGSRFNYDGFRVVVVGCVPVA